MTVPVGSWATSLLQWDLSDDEAAAEVCLQRAKAWELLAAMSLRLWQSRNQHQEAYDLLAPVYEWFTEGFDTADLQEAKKLLAELAV